MKIKNIFGIKQLIIVLTSILLILPLINAASVFAFLSYSDSSQAKIINYGESAGVVISADSLFESYMDITLDLINSADGAIVSNFLKVYSTSDSYSYGSVYNIDSSKYINAGDYKLRLTVKGASGSTSTKELSLIVLSAGTISPADTISPAITLLGSNPVNINQGSLYLDSGASAMDNVDGDITSRIVVVNPVNTNIIGSYTITYDVSDSAGNVATRVTRTVNVVAISSPTSPFPPALSGIPDQTLFANSGLNDNILDLLNYASDPDTPLSSLIFTITSETNTSIVDCSIDSNRYVECTPQTGKIGESTLAVQASDGTSTASDTFLIKVVPASATGKSMGISCVSHIGVSSAGFIECLFGDDFWEEKYLAQFAPAKPILEIESEEKKLSLLSRFLNWLF